MGGADSTRTGVRELIRRRPHPVRDEEALVILGEAQGKSRVRLAEELASSDEWRAIPLLELMPDLELMTKPALNASLSVRSSNALGRGGFETWAHLARVSPEQLL